VSKNVYSALLAARQEFDPVLKDSTNPHFKNKYASFASVLNAVTTALDKHGLILVQTTKVRENGAAILVTELVHVETGQSLDSEYPLAPGKPNDPQALGACLTYARRYSALTILGVAPEDDDGETANGRGQRESKPRKQAQTEEDNPIVRMFREAKSLDDVKTVWGTLTAKQQTRYAAEKDAAKARLGGGPTRQALQGAT
jgi:hypothetical protein